MNGVHSYMSRMTECLVTNMSHAGYHLTQTEERVVPPCPGLFRQADPPSMRAKLDSSLARRGWLVSKGDLGSEYSSVTGGTFVGEDARLYQCVARGIGPSESPDCGPAFFTGIPRSKLRHSVSASQVGGPATSGPRSGLIVPMLGRWRSTEVAGPGPL